MAPRRIEEFAWPFARAVRPVRGTGRPPWSAVPGSSSFEVAVAIVTPGSRSGESICASRRLCRARPELLTAEERERAERGTADVRGGAWSACRAADRTGARVACPPRAAVRDGSRRQAGLDGPGRTSASPAGRLGPDRRDHARSGRDRPRTRRGWELEQSSHAGSPRRRPEILKQSGERRLRAFYRGWTRIEASSRRPASGPPTGWTRR